MSQIGLEEKHTPALHDVATSRKPSRSTVLHPWTFRWFLLPSRFFEGSFISSIDNVSDRPLADTTDDSYPVLAVVLYHAPLAMGSVFQLNCVFHMMYC
jgi:hypothetical protein